MEMLIKFLNFYLFSTNMPKFWLTLNAKKVWSTVRSKATRHKLWFMQDGETCHTTENNLSILKKEFNGRIISNKRRFEMEILGKGGRFEQKNLLKYKICKNYLVQKNQFTIIYCLIIYIFSYKYKMS